MKTFSNRVNAITASPTLAMNALAKQMQAEGIDVINLGVGEPDFQTPKNISDAAIEAIQAQKTSFYTPASGLPALKQAIVENVGQRYYYSKCFRNDRRKIITVCIDAGFTESW